MTVLQAWTASGYSFSYEVLAREVDSEARFWLRSGCVRCVMLDTLGKIRKEWMA